MKKNLIMAILTFGLMVSIGCNRQESAKMPTTPAPGPKNNAVSTPPAAQTAPAETISNPLVMPHAVTDAEVGFKAKCPIMGTDITVTKGTLSAEYKGKIYYFCCGGCPDEFKKDPEKYIQK